MGKTKKGPYLTKLDQINFNKTRLDQARPDPMDENKEKGTGPDQNQVRPRHTWPD